MSHPFKVLNVLLLDWENVVFGTASKLFPVARSRQLSPDGLRFTTRTRQSASLA
jgi:hypothetical protein